MQRWLPRCSWWQLQHAEIRLFWVVLQENPETYFAGKHANTACRSVSKTTLQHCCGFIWKQEKKKKKSGFWMLKMLPLSPIYYYLFIYLLIQPLETINQDLFPKSQLRKRFTGNKVYISSLGLHILPAQQRTHCFSQTQSCPMATTLANRASLFL